MLCRVPGDLSDHVVDAGYLPDNTADCVLRAVDHVHAAFDLLFRGTNEAFDLSCSVCGTLGQCPDLLRDNGKTASAVTGACCLDAGVEGEKVRLESDLVNRADDPSDLLGGLLDIRHGVYRLTDCLAAFDRRLTGMGNRRLRRRNAGAVFGHIPDHRLDRTGGLGKGCGLLAGALRHGTANVGKPRAQRLGFTDAVLRRCQ
ncbi:hypothetical protein D3C87_1417050 [compost metagenome]